MIERIGTIDVGHGALRYDGSAFSMDSSTGILTDPDWSTVLRGMFPPHVGVRR